MAKTRKSASERKIQQRRNEVARALRLKKKQSGLVEFTRYIKPAHVEDAHALIDNLGYEQKKGGGQASKRNK